MIVVRLSSYIFLARGLREGMVIASRICRARGHAMYSEPASRVRIAQSSFALEARAKESMSCVRGHGTSRVPSR